MLLKKAGVQQEQENQLTGGMMPWLKTWTAIHWSWTSKRYQENAWWLEGLPLLAAQAFTLAAGLAGWMTAPQVAATLLTSNAVYWLLFAPAHLFKGGRLSWQALSPGEKKNALWAMGLSLFNLTLTLAAGAFTLTPVLATALGLAGLQSHNLLHLALRIHAEALKTPEQLPGLRELLGPGRIGQDYLEGHVIGRMAKQFPLLFGRTDGDHALDLAGRIRIRQGWGIGLQRSQDQSLWILTVPMWWPGLVSTNPAKGSGQQGMMIAMVLRVLFWAHQQAEIKPWPSLLLVTALTATVNPGFRLLPMPLRLVLGRHLLQQLTTQLGQVSLARQKVMVEEYLPLLSRLYAGQGSLKFTLENGSKLSLPGALLPSLRLLKQHYPELFAQPRKWRRPTRRRWRSLWGSA